MQKQSEDMSLEFTKDDSAVCGTEADELRD